MFFINLVIAKLTYYNTKMKRFISIYIVDDLLRKYEIIGFEQGIFVFLFLGYGVSW
jgi:hypothetical protein